MQMLRAKLFTMQQEEQAATGTTTSYHVEHSREMARGLLRAAATIVERAESGAASTRGREAAKAGGLGRGGGSGLGMWVCWLGCACVGQSWHRAC